GFSDFTGHANRVRKRLSWHHRFQRTFGERAVADFAPAWSADPSCFADGEIGKVIVEIELLFRCAAGVRIKFLRIFRGYKRHQNNGLSFTALEQRRTMGPGNTS